MKKATYITTTLPYVNADPHIGFALEIVQADIFARYNRLIGNEVFFNTGTDEHGQKIFEQAVAAGKDAQAYVDEYAAKFDDLKQALDLSYDYFVRTTDDAHKKAAQEFWKKCDERGDIYKKLYKVKYCVGCELEKTDSELEDGKCPLHPTKELELREEENYFFKFSNYKEKLKKFYDDNPEFIIPEKRFSIAHQLISEDGLEDFSISRLKEKMSWGIPVPGDSDHVMYVWFDALINYISAPGWPHDMENFEKRWPVIQFAGKDQVKQQGVMWQAMLMSAGVENSKQIVIHGFITSDGQKMSKSLGNVIDPFEMVEEYGTDAVRYYLARHIHPFEDSDFTKERFLESYTAHLANGLGNLASRIMKMAEDHLDACPEIPEDTIPQEFLNALEKYDVNAATDIIWERIGALDARIQETEPFKLVKEDKAAAVAIIRELVVDLYTIARMLNPIMPDTNAKLKDIIKSNKKPNEPLFPRKNEK